MKKILLLIIVLVVGMVAYIGSGPYRVMQSIQTAIKAKDADTLNQHIDFASLRTNIKAQYFTSNSAGSSSGLANSVAQGVAKHIAKRVVQGVQGTAVDVLVRPATVTAILKGQEIPELQPIIGEKVVPLDTEAPLSNSRTTYDSLGQFSIWNHHHSGKQVRIILERQGLEWKVTNVKMY